jgi:hypothetical protein
MDFWRLLPPQNREASVSYKSEHHSETHFPELSEIPRYTLKMDLNFFCIFEDGLEDFPGAPILPSITTITQI